MKFRITLFDVIEQSPICTVLSSVISSVDTKMKQTFNAAMQRQLRLLTSQKYYFIDYNQIRTRNHLVRKRTLNHLAKLASLTK